MRTQQQAYASIRAGVDLAVLKYVLVPTVHDQTCHNTLDGGRWALSLGSGVSGSKHEEWSTHRAILVNCSWVVLEVVALMRNLTLCVRLHG